MPRHTLYGVLLVGVAVGFVIGVTVTVIVLAVR